MKHLIDPTDLSVGEIAEIIALAEDIIAHRERYSEVCRGKKLATLFYEPSTRTRLSFTSAMMELGGNVIGFADAKSSSVSKGETVQDTVRVINCFADIIAMRHKVEGAPLAATDVSRTPIINAGDGSHSHPTQTMTDLLTIKRELGTLNNLTIGLVGDLKYGRTVHSLIKAMTRYEDTRFVLISPPELALPDYIKRDTLDRYGIDYQEASDIESVIGKVDVLYMTRVQQERFTDLDEYERVKDCFVLDAEKMRGAKERMAVLHPLPRVNEIAIDVDNDPRAAYFRQVENGKFVRMALILKLLEWQNDPLRTFDHGGEPLGAKCSNPLCISNLEPVRPRFERSEGIIRCTYCEHKAL